MTLGDIIASGFTPGIISLPAGATVAEVERAIAAAAGVKHDDAKPRHDLMPPDALDEVAKVLTYGAKKYGDRNWEKGMRWGRLDAAAQRHLLAFRRGENRDPESRLPHLAHAACCILFLMAYQTRKIGEDDRNPLVPVND